MELMLQCLENLPSSIEDLLVALDFRHDPPLFLQRRQRDFESFDVGLEFL